ncbi:hypothetical protein [Hydrogenophaga sp.]|uniref:hypothetical protein n=1 Tax=Hydrogenophaga sp. TaxID=1904254 RepID=UPI0027270D20|nr:hypothetical protein [Hydrogenophaga sp.]MDO9438530.1 hypothetical protein [Hydrogenophaga sp.]
MPQGTDLSPVEWQLLCVLSTGASNKRIAHEQGKSEFTMRNQLSALKIAVVNRTPAVFWYRECKDAMVNSGKAANDEAIHAWRAAA